MQTKRRFSEHYHITDSPVPVYILFYMNNLSICLSSLVTGECCLYILGTPLPPGRPSSWVRSG